MKYFRGIYLYDIYFNGFHGQSLSHIFLFTQNILIFLFIFNREKKKGDNYTKILLHACTFFFFFFQTSKIYCGNLFLLLSSN